MNKREFLQLGAGLATLAVREAYGSTSAARVFGRTLIDGRGVAIHDERYPDSMRFARALFAAGALRIPVQADIVRLWHGRFPEVLQQDCAWIGGLTTGSDQTVVEACVKPYGFIKFFTGRHDGRGAGQLAHTLDYRGADFDLAGIFTDGSWAERLAETLSARGLPEGVARMATAHSSRPAVYPGTLFSWLLVRNKWELLAKTQSPARKLI